MTTSSTSFPAALRLATAVDYPPMQAPASFNLDAVKRKIDETVKNQAGQ
ncbi:hypothetical protein [Xanthobacter autotrophicus]